MYIFLLRFPQKLACAAGALVLNSASIAPIHVHTEPQFSFQLEMACVGFHREQLSIEHSMKDLDSAVGRLDNILMSLYFIVAILIIAVALEAQLVTLITGAGTLVLGA